MQKIIPHLWFNDQAEEAVNFYTSIFKNSKILGISHYGDAGSQVSGRPKNSIMTIRFQLKEREFVALNGGPYFTFSPAISFLVNCNTQEEIDTLWERLSHDKESEQCGWLKDKFGVSWQIVPLILEEMMSSSNTEKREKAMKALLKMTKLDIQTLKQAYED
ncbi:VOC family protein [Legionella hackeliae]|uniref:3-demethylubiquinone-9 3-methyltransferase n=1 Tax=Legionella hackeliae TaxID=449 RepID=A0A0A8UY89_LEGHA|nr:VOC family protein [Legionella hackeliae]KTD09974.1 DNA binding protein [Legionella hackeliae]CEK11724.1 3-demethylubiquinone-9 3-methyltransferase [Legionella hackeliae]STX48494.1 DNA binding protein [Legionella hackeliae]